MNVSKYRNALIVFFFTAAIAGFMIKLPAPLRKTDKECHALFFFLAAAFLNAVLQIKKPGKHLLVFCFLILFGIIIEISQDFSNHFFKRRIHGHFDPMDVKYDLAGAIAFSVVWLVWYGLKAIGKSGEKLT